MKWNYDLLGSAILPRLEALPMNNDWAGFLVLLLCDPHLLESGQETENGAANPH